MRSPCLGKLRIALYSWEKLASPSKSVATVCRRRQTPWCPATRVRSQGLQAPPFLGSDGGPIFPPEESEDYVWWITDASRNRKQDEQKGDEDGPQSSESEAAQDEGERKADDALVSDSDPDSSRSERGDSQSQTTVVLPVRHDTRPRRDPDCAWASRRS